MNTDSQKTGLIGTMISWWKQPFNSKGDAFMWVMFVGFLVIVVFLWNLVLIELIRKAEGEIA